MDFTSIFKGNMTTMSENMTSGKPNKMLESLLPMFGGQFSPVLRTVMFFYQMVGNHLGIDPTMILTFFGFIWAANKLGRQVYMTLYGIIQENFMSSVHVSSTDEIYTHMMKWLAMQPLMTSSRSLTAETVSKTAWEEEEELEALKTSSVSGGGDAKYLNFSNQEAKAPPRFVPAVGIHGFWHEGTFFRLHRKQQSVFDDGGGWQTFKEKEDLVISCFGRNPEPIKKLLQYTKEFYYSDHYARTTIKRPSPQQVRRYGGRYNWNQVANRPVRPLKTVVLDPKQKAQVLADMNEYLHPATPRWYANRGIPLRRGYLFYGPPGTGKTSLSFALAGVFGLDIYVISLLEPTLTEEDLGTLFNSLPRRCVVLLEDIDTAGLSRPVDVTEEEPSKDKKDGKKGETTKAKEDWKVSDLARALKKDAADDKKGISPSGLLNAIDGVASQEGRILVMTTNKPESLDEALIRPGRVDLQVGFTNATQQQATELFHRMYEVDNARSARATGPPETGDEAVDHVKDETNGTTVTNGDAKTEGENNIGIKELMDIAAEFGAKIPDGLFSPAEIQGFLLKRKTDPRQALADSDVWVEGMRTQKESKTKVLKVQ